MTRVVRILRRCLPLLLALCAPLAAVAQDDPPGRVGRIATMQGAVSMFDNEQGQWVPAVPNRPLTGGDRLSTDPGGRAELRVGSTTLRLGGSSELEVLRLDDDRVSLQLHAGSLALRVRSREVADETEVVTAEAKMHPLGSGHFRIDRVDDSSYAAAWRGQLRVEDNDQPFTVDAGRRAEIWREGSAGVLRRSWTPIPDDDFSRWVARDDQRDERSVSNRYVSPEMTGAEDLDRYGSWQQSPDYGPVWIPTVVAADWAPYRYGRWAWVAPWGWTWVDDAPWGFAPFHYGRWVSWGGRWCWTPGAYVARPVYAPALVAWVGGSRFGVSVGVGGPAQPVVGWVPLAPREVFVPYYVTTPVYIGRVNHRAPGWTPPVPTGPVMYGNQNVPNAVTVVSSDVLVRRQPVARAVVDVHDAWRKPLPVQAMAPVPAPTVQPIMRPQPGAPVRAPSPRGAGLVAVPGGAEPVTPPPRRDGREAPPPAVRANPAQNAPAVVDLRQQQRDRAQQQQQQQQGTQARDRAAQEQAARERAARDRAAQERAAQERQTQERQAQEQRQAQERQARERPAAPPQAAPEQPQQQPAPRQRPAEEPGKQHTPESRVNMRDREQVR